MRPSWLTSMRTYVFVAMLAVMLIPVAYMVQQRESAAFEREMVKVQESHLTIAKNMAAAMARYAADLKATFEFVVGSADYFVDTVAEERLLSTYDLHYVAALDADNVSQFSVPERGLVLPDAAILAELRAEAQIGKTTISGIKQVGDRALMFLLRTNLEGDLFIGAFDRTYLVALQKAIAFGDRGHAMIVDSKGRVIAHPNPEWERILKDASPLSVVQRMIAGQTGVTQFYSPPMQADMVAGYTYVEGAGWGVMVPQPIMELEAAARVEASQLTETLAILVLIAAAVSWLLSGAIVGPLQTVSQTVRSIRNGQHDARVPKLPPYAPSEAKSMSNLFNGLMTKFNDDQAVLEGSLKAAETANAHKAKAISILSHEMRTPLNGIVGALDLMEQGKMTAEQKALHGIMTTSSATLLRHVGDVLEVSRLDSSQVSIDKSGFDVRTLLSEIVAENLPIAQRRGNMITVTTGKDMPQIVVADRQKLRNIAANLVGNANKFSTDGTIKVTVAMVDRGQMELRVSDNGPGIGAEDQDRIFEPFTVLDASYGRSVEGTGLGLSIVSKTATALGGTYGVESEVGQGSTFWVRVPVSVPAKSDATQSAAPTQLAEVPQTATAGKDVLVVDDNEINRVVLVKLLAGLGYNVDTAESGEEALTKAMHDQFDLILMDISMPGIDGTEATQILRKKDGPNRDTAIVAQTAHASPEDHDRFKHAGMQDVLTKPITIQKFKSVLSQLDPSLA